MDQFNIFDGSTVTKCDVCPRRRWAVCWRQCQEAERILEFVHKRSSNLLSTMGYEIDQPGVIISRNGDECTHNDPVHGKATTLLYTGEDELSQVCMYCGGIIR